ncbi:MAG: hypothetical protein NTV52_01695, partial [Acidobacteria bacterium]|nr:hypothetical protein [Acidobacteriota bacterium]
MIPEGMEYGIRQDMGMARKITVAVPEDLLRRAQNASGGNVTQTVLSGLAVLAAGHAYAQLRQMRGTVTFSRSW